MEAGDQETLLMQVSPSRGNVTLSVTRLLLLQLILLVKLASVAIVLNLCARSDTLPPNVFVVINELPRQVRHFRKRG